MQYPAMQSLESKEDNSGWGYRGKPTMTATEKQSVLIMEQWDF